jgi:hypothetical protein
MPNFWLKWTSPDEQSEQSARRVLGMKKMVIAGIESLSRMTRRTLCLVNGYAKGTVT